jgi:hypothetical protein
MRKAITPLVVTAAVALIAGAGCKQDEPAATADTRSGSASTYRAPSASASPRSTSASASPYSTGGSTGMTSTGNATPGASAQRAAESTGRAAQDAVDSTGRATQGAADSTADTVGDAARDASSAGASAPARPAAGSAASGSTAEAQKLLDQASQYIKENKWDLADQTLTSLEAMKSQLPASVGTQIDSTRKLLNTARSGGSLLGGGTGAAPK